jgi:Predicted glycosyltransferases
MSDASVVLCSYTEDRWDDILAAVESLERQTVAPAEIILVVDYNPGLFERAKSLRGVVAIENSRARGASGARNSGVAAARGSIVVLLDDDATADPDWLEMLLSAYDQPNVAGVGGSIVPEWLAETPRWFPEEFNWVVGCTYRGMPTTAHVRNLIAANMSVHRHVWESVGGFKEGFGNVKSPVGVGRGGKSGLVGCEETEFCIRVSQAFPSLKWVYEPRARVLHHVPSHRSTWRYFLSRCRKEGLGKARLASVVGRESALKTERLYVTRTLAAGVARGLQEAILEWDINGLRRAGAIVAGLAMTTTGYVEARVRKPA